MSQSDRFDNFNGENGEVSSSPDAYTTESSEDIYNTPEVVAESASVEEMPGTEIVAENVSDTKTSDAVVPYNNQNNNNPYGNPSYDNNPYGNPSYNNNPYGNNPYNNNPYGNNPYKYNPYGGQMPQNDNQASNPYNNNQYNNSQYNNNQYNNNQYNNNQYNSGQYNGNQYNSNQYGNNPYGNGPSGIPPYGNNPYSPYAMPPKKNKSGLIIGIVVAIIVLFLVAVFALIYRAFSLLSVEKSRTRNNRSEYRFDYDEDDWRTDRNQRDTDPDDYFGNHYGDYDYDDWYDYDDYDYDDWYGDYGYDDYYYDDSGKYYDFHDDIKHNLSYSVDFEYYRHDTNHDNVVIEAEYPVISGKSVANLDKLNGTIRDEVDSFIEFYDEQYADLIIDDDDYYEAYIVTYVTYMDEEKMSIVFDERIYGDYYSDVYLYCINIDMEHGVVMNNENILSINDDFSVDFRERSDEQNGEISALSMMSDQQITRLFNSEQIIVFYTPMGMEIGFNYDEGWVTVTYEDYEQYLKVF